MPGLIRRNFLVELSAGSSFSLPSRWHSTICALRRGSSSSLSPSVSEGSCWRWRSPLDGEGGTWPRSFLRSFIIARGETKKSQSRTIFRTSDPRGGPEKGNGLRLFLVRMVSVKKELVSVEEDPLWYK